MKKVLGIILSVGIILGIGGYFLVKESYAATPADPLFAVQELADDIQRTLTFDEVAQVELEEEILGRRQEQVDRMLEREDITGEQLEEALKLMAQQRERVEAKLQVAEQNVVRNQNEEGENTAQGAIEKVREQYDENLDEQLETVGKSQEKYGSVDQEVVDDLVQEATSRGRTIPSGLGGNEDNSNGSEGESNGSSGNSGNSR
jgi:alkanesulfonate monooxygenase SsuD/methylene tetrahydromethanopterin reductase-like flavin-dependent oxidoreductase (luciferase family)